MPCPNCGREDPAPGGFCSHCGHASTPAAVPGNTPSGTPPNSGSNLAGCFIGAAVGTVLAAILMFLPFAFAPGLYGGAPTAAAALAPVAWLLETFVVLCVLVYFLSAPAQRLPGAVRSGAIVAAIVVLGGLAPCDMLAVSELTQITKAVHTPSGR